MLSEGTAEQPAGSNDKCKNIRAHRFQPGKSGNPSGRPKKVIDVAALARDGSTKAMEKLVKLIDSNDDRTALAASIAVLDRALGKPKVTVENTTKREAADYTRDELIQIARMGRARAVEARVIEHVADCVQPVHVPALPASSASRDDCREA